MRTHTNSFSVKLRGLRQEARDLGIYKPERYSMSMLHAAIRAANQPWR